jgi:hypothetical protein
LAGTRSDTTNENSKHASTPLITWLDANNQRRMAARKFWPRRRRAGKSFQMILIDLEQPCWQAFISLFAQNHARWRFSDDFG